MNPEGRATGPVCGLRLFVDEGYPMARDGPWHGRDADPSARQLTAPRGLVCPLHFLLDIPSPLW
jgi:hypothetical protein